MPGVAPEDPLCSTSVRPASRLQEPSADAGYFSSYLNESWTFVR